MSNPYAPPTADDDSPPTASYGLRVAARLLDGLSMALVGLILYALIFWARLELPPQLGVLVALPMVVAKLFTRRTPGELLCGIKRDGRRRWIVVR